MPEIVQKIQQILGLDRTTIAQGARVVLDNFLLAEAAQEWG